MHETQQYENLSKDDFQRLFNFKTNPEFCLHWIANNNPKAVMANFKNAGLISQNQETAPDLIYTLLLSYLNAGRYKQLRELIRVPVDQQEPSTISPAILEALNDLQSSTRNVA